MTTRQKRYVIELITKVFLNIILLIFLFTLASNKVSNYTKEGIEIETKEEVMIITDKTGKEWKLSTNNVTIKLEIDNNNSDTNTNDDTIKKIVIKTKGE